jgi:hypothetical protein
MSRDLRKYARQTQIRLLVGFIILLFVIGSGAIYVFYGRDASILGLLCLLAGLAPLLIIWIILSAMDWIVKRAREE